MGTTESADDSPLPTGHATRRTTRPGSGTPSRYGPDRLRFRCRYTHRCGSRSPPRPSGAPGYRAGSGVQPAPPVRLRSCEQVLLGQHPVEPPPRIQPLLLDPVALLPQVVNPSPVPVASRFETFLLRVPRAVLQEREQAVGVALEF